MIDLHTYSTHLQLRPEKIWAARGSEVISYPDDGNAVCYEIEENSFWYAHRNRCISEAMTQYPPSGLFFDVGGGNGIVSQHLNQCGYPTVLVEPGRSGAMNARQRGIENIVWASLEETCFISETLPAVGMFDVLEHIKNDTKTVSEIYRILAPGGRFYVTVPAYDWLWSYNDTHLGHFRRYTVEELSDLMIAAGFEIDYATYIFTMLPIPILIRRTLPDRLGFRKTVVKETKRREHKISNGILNKIIHVFFEREMRCIKRREKMTVGASCLIIVHKPLRLK